LYMSLRRWERAQFHAKEMGRIARNMYEQKKKRTKKSARIHPAKPLFGYILYANLLLGSICDEKDVYNRALYYLSLYKDHSWIEERDIDAENTKRQFSEWAVANNYLYRIMLGEVDLLDEYIEHISVRESEVLRALFKIIKAANRHGFDMDKILQRFESTISLQINKGEAMGTYTQQVTDDGFANFLADVGAYYLNKNEIKTGVKFVLDSLATSIKISNFDMQQVKRNWKVTLRL
ncbi:helix-turn-helix domain-containing protein, partial [Bacillus subtilis]